MTDSLTENQRLKAALAGEVGLVALLCARAELQHVREEILNNHRHVAAINALSDESSEEEDERYDCPIHGLHCPRC